LFVHKTKTPLGTSHLHRWMNTRTMVQEDKVDDRLLCREEDYFLYGSKGLFSATQEYRYR
jgi:hypothetical protein